MWHFTLHTNYFPAHPDMCSTRVPPAKKAVSVSAARQQPSVPNRPWWQRTSAQATDRVRSEIKVNGNVWKCNGKHFARKIPTQRQDGVRPTLLNSHCHTLSVLPVNPQEEHSVIGAVAPRLRRCTSRKIRKKMVPKSGEFQIFQAEYSRGHGNG